MTTDIVHELRIAAALAPTREASELHERAADQIIALRKYRFSTENIETDEIGRPNGD